MSPLEKVGVIVGSSGSEVCKLVRLKDATRSHQSEWKHLSVN
jgi:hypothetical protein